MIKQSFNKALVSGVIVSIEHTFGPAGPDQKPALYGTVTIETGEDNLVPIGFFAYKQKKDGKDNPVYASLSTVVAEYKTIQVHGRDLADKITVGQGTISENVFFSNGNMIRGFQTSSIFFNRDAKAEPSAKFQISGELIQMVDEVIKDVPTGRLLLSLILVGYENRADIVDFVVENPAGVNYIKSSASIGDEIKVSGDIVVKETEEETSEATAFGDDIVTTKRRTERSLVVTSATAPTASGIEDSERTAMLSVREERIAKAKAKAEKKATSAPAATAPAAKGNFSL